MPRNTRDKWFSVAVAQEKEIDRLYAALKAISDLDGRHDLPDAWKIARKALRSTK